MADNDGTPPDQRPSEVKPVAPAPRANPPNVNTAKETPVGGPPGFGDFLEWMRTQMGGETAAPTESQRTLIPKEKKKFQRRDAESKADKAVTFSEEAGASAKTSSPTPQGPPAAGVSAGVAARESMEGAPPTIRPPQPGAFGDGPEPQTPRVRRGQQPGAKRNSWIGLLVQIGVAVLLVGSFLLGRLSVSKTVPVVAAAPAAPEVINKEGKLTTNLLSDANAALIDQAMAAEQSFDFKKAKELLEKVKASGEHVHGLAFQLAQLAVFAGENLRAVQLLNEALNEGEELASVYNLRATISPKGNMLRTANMNDYETAAKADPFDARNFFYWGSALRWAGKPQAALVRLRQALDRLREPTAEGQYRLAIRLTQIELGQEQEFADALRKQMALPYPGMDWLFTAAALAIRNGKPAEAAADLARAEQCGDPDGFDLRISDYYLDQHRFDKELKPFFDRAKSAQPGSVSGPAAPAESPANAETTPPAVGLDVPMLPPPASPGATVAR